MEVVLNMTQPTYRGDFIIINKFIHQNEVLDADMILVNNTGTPKKSNLAELKKLQTLMKTNYTAYLERMHEGRVRVAPIYLFETNETKTTAVVNLDMHQEEMTQTEEDEEIRTGRGFNELFEIKMNRPLENAYPGAYSSCFEKLFI